MYKKSLLSEYLFDHDPYEEYNNTNNIIVTDEDYEYNMFGQETKEFYNELQYDNIRHEGLYLIEKHNNSNNNIITNSHMGKDGVIRFLFNHHYYSVKYNYMMEDDEDYVEEFEE